VGELVKQGDDTTVAKALKAAQVDRECDIKRLIKTVAKGYVRQKKQLGQIKGEKPKSKPKLKPKPSTKPKSKSKKAAKGCVFKATAVRKGKSK
jgi:hypothetical protein